MGRDYESEVRAMTKLAIVVPISLIIIFIILLVLFRKIRDVLLALMNVPFAIIGGILALLLTGTNFNISAGMDLLHYLGYASRMGS